MDKKTITKQIEDLEVLMAMADSYARISSSRMQKTRGSVVTSRDFLFEIQGIFEELQASYLDEFKRLARKKGFKKGEKITLLAHNGRKVAVLLSTNTGFYGSLVRNIFDLFAEDIKKNDVEATIVGKLGLEIFLDVFPGRSYSYFELPDYGVDRDKMSELVRHLVPYEEIHLYYGKFKNLVTQVPEEKIISAQTQMGDAKKGSKVKYLFEPSLEEILMFFETEMFSSFFEQAISEAQLAKYASRMLAMDSAWLKMKENLHESRLAKSRIIHALNDRRQLEYFSSIAARGRVNYG